VPEPAIEEGRFQDMGLQHDHQAAAPGAAGASSAEAEELRFADAAVLDPVFGVLQPSEDDGLPGSEGDLLRRSGGADIRHLYLLATGAGAVEAVKVGARQRELEQHGIVGEDARGELQRGACDHGARTQRDLTADVRGLVLRHFREIAPGVHIGHRDRMAVQGEQRPGPNVRDPTAL